VFVPEDDLSQVPIDRLEADIASIASDLGRRLEQWLALVAEFDRRGGARRWGYRGTAEWLAWRCGLTQRTARDHVRVARELAARPLMRAGLASGELSYSKVRAISRAPAGEREAALVDLARSATAGEVEQVVRALRSAPSAGVDVINHAYERRFVAWSWEQDGSLSIRGRLPAEDGAAFIEMIETAAAAMYGSSGRRGSPAAADDAAPESDSLARRPPWGARRADALAEIAHSGSPRTQVVVHVDTAALACTADEAAQRAGETCELEHGPAVPSESARRLGCDATLITARRAQDGSIDYGRERRTVPAPLRTVLERRDRHCRFPGCERRHDLHAHHVQHWAHGGTTHKDNLVLLCRFHHRLVHEGGFTVLGSRDGTFLFARPDGRVVHLARGQPIAA
jgi:Domain of unknown function (DUF222)/HNH endonuclease